MQKKSIAIVGFRKLYDLPKILRNLKVKKKGNSKGFAKGVDRHALESVYEQIQEGSV